MFEGSNNRHHQIYEKASNYRCAKYRQNGMIKSLENHNQRVECQFSDCKRQNIEKITHD